MALAVIRVENNYLGVEAEEGQYYSTLTGSDPPHLENVWLKLESFLGNNTDYRLTIFESEQGARNYILQHGDSDTPYDIIKLFDLDGLEEV